MENNSYILETDERKGRYWGRVKASSPEEAEWQFRYIVGLSFRNCAGNLNTIYRRYVSSRLFKRDFKVIVCSDESMPYNYTPIKLVK